MTGFAPGVVEAELHAVAVDADPEALHGEVRRARDRLSMACGVLAVAECDPPADGPASATSTG